MGERHSTFAAAFRAHLTASGRQIREISRTSGVPHDALYSLKYGKSRNMGVNDAIRVAQAFGMTFEQFMRGPEVAPSDDLHRMMLRLTDKERMAIATMLAELRPPHAP